MAYDIVMPTPHEKQKEFVETGKKRVMVRAGRRGGKTVGVAIRAAQKFLAGKRVLYAAPTIDQVDRFWTETCRIFQDPIDQKIFNKNSTRHILELPGTERRIRAKTAWNADTLRGDYADELILDEFQLMNEEVWGVVGAPMLADNNGDAAFIYTPPSLASRSASKANDPQHAAKMFKRIKTSGDPRWKLVHFSSHDNPHISSEALDELSNDMTALAYRMEIMAEDVDEAPGALWTRHTIESHRVYRIPDQTERIIIGVDPSETSTGDEAGIVAAALSGGHGYILGDDSLQGSPLQWAQAAVAAYHRHHADMIVAESNAGGEMVALTIATVDPNIRVKLVHSSRGKIVRADPIAAQYEHGLVHNVGSFPKLEDEMCLFVPGGKSPNRLDAMVFALIELDLSHKSHLQVIDYKALGGLYLPGGFPNV